MKVIGLAAGCLLSLVIGAAQASSAMTEQNLQRFVAMMPEMEALDDRFPEQSNAFEQELELQQHCNWQRHYDSTVVRLAPAGYRQELESILKRHNFSPAEFTELSFKFSWGSFQLMAPMYEMMQQMLQHLPEEERAEQEAEMRSLEQMKALLDRCMSDAEKATVTALVADMMQQMMQMDHETMQQMEQMMQQMQ
ncbi:MULTISPECIES: hypothetical protein [Alkalimonas]|uniref:DUF2059 domain-containing protein n=1 Tax=Alkalimonas mucilaginosa TaxID=3057676 RepID=A0ABU7JIH7_9GAMM|nr:hypothetical protein [Alkalimonas sp. MEB004]MEE2025479.1 hypothetical protein [Alkalimonas sp. MEB004]